MALVLSGRSADGVLQGDAVFETSAGAGDEGDAGGVRPGAQTGAQAGAGTGLGAQGRAAVRAITLGTVRWCLRLQPAVESLLTRQADRMDPQLRALLLVAAHQIEYSRNPPERTVHEAVDAARALGQAHAAGMVNAVLRRFAARKAELFAAVDADVAAASAHPPWLARALQAAWPGQWRAILDADNAHPPLTLRVDLSRTRVADFLRELEAAGLEGQALPWAPAAVRLVTPVPVQAIPGFAAGSVSVQDAGAQLAAVLLDARPGMRVLDACAAPGGKTVHLLERTPDLAELVAVDIDAARLRRVRENLERTGREAQLLVADMTQVGAALADMPVSHDAAPSQGLPAGLPTNLPMESSTALARPFDRILLDAPCSATGVIRRHPDIKLLRRASDLESLAVAQLAILRRAFGLLAPGGRLLYCTCSVLPEENAGVIARFLEQEPGARDVELPLSVLPPGSVRPRYGVQLLPGTQADTDGFYYACVEKS